YHVRKDAAHLVLIAGDRNIELFGRYEENAYMWRMMNLIGRPDTQLYELGGYGHGAMAQPAFHILIQTIHKMLGEKYNF
ncbi:alpha/beta hydrolase, partial [Pseudomonas donghuensis]|nr:alpha/beta hydrolase [Pseudomonas donghuensis]